MKRRHERFSALLRSCGYSVNLILDASGFTLIACFPRRGFPVRVLCGRGMTERTAWAELKAALKELWA